MSYHISREGEKLGVFTEEEVIEGLHKGKILPSDELWTEGMEDWQPVHEVIEADEDEEAPEAPEPEPAPPEEPPAPEPPEEEPPPEEPIEEPAPIIAPAKTEAPKQTPPAEVAPAVVYLPVGPSMEQGQYGVAGPAIAGTVLGILSLITGFLTGIPALLAGHLARRQIRRSGGAYSGDGLAVAGLIMGYVTSAVSLSWLMLLLFGFPVPGSQWLQGTKSEFRVRGEGRELAMVLKKYATTHTTHFPNTLEQLVQEKGIDPERLKVLQRTELGPQWKGEPGWSYLGDGNPDSDANDRPLLVSKMVDAEGHHLVIYHDGSAEKAEIVSK